MSALATIVTLVIAAPVIRAPSERIFGMAVVGRHHDPFTVMEQFGRPFRVNLYSQPITDVTGALLARVVGVVAAYNWLILLSFPLSAVGGYLLARYLSLSPGGATVAAMAFAFSPFHLAHAAYHPHIAQTQWLPLYLLALWRCLDTPSPVAVAILGAATMAVTLSNFYGGLIAAVMTPVAVTAHWLATRRTYARPNRRLVITAGSLVAIAASGMAYVTYAAPEVVENRAAFAFPRVDLFRYSANAWGYLLPPVEHPLLGQTARRIWDAIGVRDGLLEQQISLGWSAVALGLIAVFRWTARGSDARPPASITYVPGLVILAVAAFACSLTPEYGVGPLTVVRPSGLLYQVVPMFRSYARFGVVVQLSVALLAGIGVDALRRARTARARIACLGLVAFVVCEYAVAPWDLWRDVLPTTAHRWITRQPGSVWVLDCMRPSQRDASVQWLAGNRVTLQGPATNDCTEPNLPQKLAAIGYTHLLVRRNTLDGRWFSEHPTPDGLRVVATFEDSQVFAVAAGIPPIYSATMTGFFPREHNAEWSWRWMAVDATWTIVNTRATPIAAVIDLDMSAFSRARHMEVRLDGRPVQTLLVEPSRRVYQIGPLTVPIGEHELQFHPTEAPTVPADMINNRDRRPLSFALGSWSWAVPDGQL